MTVQLRRGLDFQSSTQPNSALQHGVKPTLSAKTAGAAAGALSRLGVNSITDAVVKYGQGDSRPLKNVTNREVILAMVAGSLLQSAAVFGLEDAVFGQTKKITKDDSDQQIPRNITHFFQYFCIGAISRLPMHPSCIAFFLNEKFARTHDFIPEIQIIMRIVRTQPKLFFRGLTTGMIMNGLDWGLYLTIRERYGDTIAAIVAILLTTPLYQRYINDIIAYPSKTTTEKIVVTSTPRDKTVYALLIAIAIFERYLTGVIVSALPTEIIK